jgi:antitoxin component YwqK of YwqJK toxin-antitoxin module
MKKILITLALIFFITETSADYRVLELIRSKASAKAKSNASKSKSQKKSTKAKVSASKTKKLKKIVKKPNVKPKERVTSEELDIRNDIAYLPNEDAPFTGKHIENHVNGKKYIEIQYKDGRKDGLVIMWDEYGHKVGEINYTNGQRVD